jgi:hypothetical protein
MQCQTNLCDISISILYIKHSDAELDVEWKLLLMNNNESYIISQFITLANENHIRLLSFLLHLIYCMKFLNINVFESYKHWCNKIIVKIVFWSVIKYSLFYFLNDLIKIKINTFKKDISREIFENRACDHSISKIV